MAKNKKTKSIEESLWGSANKLGGSLETVEYKHVVLGLIFLKLASDKFEERRKELIDEGKENYLEMKKFYNMKNVFFLPEESPKAIVTIYHTLQTRKRINMQLKETIKPLCPVLMKGVMDGVVEPEKEREAV